MFAPNLTSHNTTAEDTKWMTEVTRVLINSARHIGRRSGELQRRMDQLTDEEAVERYRVMNKPPKRRKSSVVGLMTAAAKGAGAVIKDLSSKPQGGSYKMTVGQVRQHSIVRRSSMRGSRKMHGTPRATQRASPRRSPRNHTPTKQMATLTTQGEPGR